MKIVKLDDKSHLLAKAKAKKTGMTLQGYLMMLILKDNE